MRELTKVRSIEIEQHTLQLLIFFLTGTVLFSSKSGSGGGAIELIAENGILTVGKRFRILRILELYFFLICLLTAMIYSNDNELTEAQIKRVKAQY